MTDQEKNQLRADVAAFLNPKPADPVVPLPAQANRAAMTPAQQEVAFDNWVTHINSQPTSTWTAEEKNAIRFASARVLKELGYK